METADGRQALEDRYRLTQTGGVFQKASVLVFQRPVESTSVCKSIGGLSGVLTAEVLSSVGRCNSALVVCIGSSDEAFGHRREDLRFMHGSGIVKCLGRLDAVDIFGDEDLSGKTTSREAFGDGSEVGSDQTERRTCRVEVVVDLKLS